MSVYDLDIKGMRKIFLEFNKTLYGRTIFVLVYFIPMVAFLAGVASVVGGLLSNDIASLQRSLLFFLCFIPVFILANLYFYSEIRKFCEHKKK